MGHSARTWTLEEAEAALPEVQEMLAEARAALRAVRHAQDQIEDLKIVYGRDVGQEGNPGFGEWEVHSRRLLQAKPRLQKVRDAFAYRGIELKDIDTGLIDFYADRGDERVFLCWKDGEKRIRAWHTLDGGFARRRPIESLVDWRRA